MIQETNGMRSEFCHFDAYTTKGQRGTISLPASFGSPRRYCPGSRIVTVCRVGTLVLQPAMQLKTVRSESTASCSLISSPHELCGSQGNARSTVGISPLSPSRNGSTARSVAAPNALPHSPGHVVE